MYVCECQLNVSENTGNRKSEEDHVIVVIEERHQIIMDKSNIVISYLKILIKTLYKKDLTLNTSYRIWSFKID